MKNYLKKYLAELLSSAKIKEDAQKQKVMIEDNLAKELFEKTIKKFHDNNI
jgi:hypothetical protein